MPNQSLPPAELAAAAFLAGYRGRTVESYRHDLRSFFAWAEEVGLEVPFATRPQLDLYVRHLEETGLAPSTVDRRVSTVCGFYRFAHVDGVIASNPAQLRPAAPGTPQPGSGSRPGELAAFLLAAERCDQGHTALAVLLGLNGLRISEACSPTSRTSVSSRGHGTLSILDKGSKPALIALVPRTARTVDLAIWHAGF
ncbi:MAG TPA: site-specific integrase [Acidimicrobiales bacterium]|nr:site-specific integrase [Acidimicrobiales bacterium]